uniref:Uncharacterized protein n=1 Tax=Moniliophthora roreri TaxID=221103 RepID=A0A0W0FAY6_MONRR
MSEEHQNPRQNGLEAVFVSDNFIILGKGSTHHLLELKTPTDFTRN